MTQKVTRDFVVSLFIKRQRLVLDASVSIANMLPAAWEVIEQHLEHASGMTNLLLTDLEFDPVTEMLTYGVAEQHGSIGATVSIPLSLALAPGEDGAALTEYLSKLPVVGSEYDGDVTETQEDKIKMQLIQTLLAYPDMYIDIDRLTELELQSLAGTFVKYPAAEGIQ